LLGDQGSAEVVYRLGIPHEILLGSGHDILRQGVVRAMHGGHLTDGDEIDHQHEDQQDTEGNGQSGADAEPEVG
jgi:hypothetical protein